MLNICHSAVRSFCFAMFKDCKINDVSITLAKVASGRVEVMAVIKIYIYDCSFGLFHFVSNIMVQP